MSWKPLDFEIEEAIASAQRDMASVRLPAPTAMNYERVLHRRAETLLRERYDKSALRNCELAGMLSKAEFERDYLRTWVRRLNWTVIAMGVITAICVAASTMPAGCAQLLLRLAGILLCLVGCGL